MRIWPPTKAYFLAPLCVHHGNTKLNAKVGRHSFNVVFQVFHPYQPITCFRQRNPVYILVLEGLETDHAIFREMIRKAKVPNDTVVD